MLLEQNKKILFSHNIFNKLTAQEKNFLEEKSIEITYKKKEIIFKQKSHAHYVCFIIKGLTKTFMEGANDKCFLIRIHKPNDIIGSSHIYDSPYYNYSTLALKDSLCVQMPVENIRTLIESNNDFAAELIKFNCSNAQFLYNKLFTLGTKQMHGRLVDTILELSQPEFLKEEIFSFVSRKDISELTGMSLESAIRLISEFKNDGLIRAEGKRIIVNSRELLLRLSDIG